MEFYLVNIFIIMCYGVILNIYGGSKYGDFRKSNKVFIILACIHLGLIMALRSINVGVDTKTYSGLFEQISVSDDIFSVIKSAPVYVIYNKIISIAFTNSQWIILFNSTIIIIGIGLSIYRNSTSMTMSIYCYTSLYFYFTSFNITRQFIAVVLIANSYYYLKNNNTKKFIILILLATAIHNTAIVASILFPLRKIKWTNGKLCLFSVLCVSIMFLYEKILNIFLMVFPRYQMYMGNNKVSLSDMGEGKKIFVSFFYLCIVILGIFILRYKKSNYSLAIRNEMYFLTSIILIGTIMGIIFYNNLLISRIEIYFSIFIIIYIPLIVSQLGKLKLLACYSLVIITAIPMLVQLNKNISGVVPYSFFWIN